MALHLDIMAIPDKIANMTIPQLIENAARLGNPTGVRLAIELQKADAQINDLGAQVYTLENEAERLRARVADLEAQLAAKSELLTVTQADFREASQMIRQAHDAVEVMHAALIKTGDLP